MSDYTTGFQSEVTYGPEHALILAAGSTAAQEAHDGEYDPNNHQQVASAMQTHQFLGTVGNIVQHSL